MRFYLAAMSVNKARCKLSSRFLGLFIAYISGKAYQFTFGVIQEEQEFQYVTR
jgi:hypothetical protein